MSAQLKCFRYAAAIENTTISSSSGTAVTVSSQHTKGSYVQLIASSTYDAEGIVVSLKEDGGSKHCLVDIAVGGAGSEQVIAQNLLIGGIQMQRYFLPVRVPAGSRVSARIQSDLNGTSTIYTKVMLLPGTRRSDWTGSQVVSIGADTSTSGGVNVDPGGTANTKGSWTQLVASLGQNIRGLAIAAARNTNFPGNTACDWMIDIGVGGAGSEQVVVPDVWFYASTFNDMRGGANLFLPFVIAEGSRIAVRAACSSNAATDRNVQVACYGVY